MFPIRMESCSSRSACSRMPRRPLLSACLLPELASALLLLLLLNSLPRVSVDTSLDATRPTHRPLRWMRTLPPRSTLGDTDTPPPRLPPGAHDPLCTGCLLIVFIVPPWFPSFPSAPLLPPSFAPGFRSGTPRYLREGWSSAQPCVRVSYVSSPFPHVNESESEWIVDDCEWVVGFSAPFFFLQQTRPRTHADVGVGVPSPRPSPFR
mmetsp:Transcript_13355/g.33534  ORF Transcript_13355/g.33534 Transcript_13355/m.33534 type:complete len:207 (+) Transcript_13355:1162-1782(+)